MNKIKKDFIMIGNETWKSIIESTKDQNALVVYIALLSHRNGKTGLCFPSKQCLAKEVISYGKRKRETEPRAVWKVIYRKDYVFKRDNGKPFTPDYVSKHFSKLLKKTDCGTLGSMSSDTVVRQDCLVVALH